MNQTEVNALLQRLGAIRWDTAAPQDGTIAWFDAAGRKVAWGRYRIILAFGPGTEFTMAWAIGAYQSAGVPVVPKQGDDLAKAFLATEAQAWEKALAIAHGVGARFAYRCATLYVAVDDFHVDEALVALLAEPPPLAAERPAVRAPAAPNASPKAARKTPAAPKKRSATRKKPTR